MISEYLGFPGKDAPSHSRQGSIFEWQICFPLDFMPFSVCFTLITYPFRRMTAEYEHELLSNEFDAMHFGFTPRGFTDQGLTPSVL